MKSLHTESRQGGSYFFSERGNLEDFQKISLSSQNIVEEMLNVGCKFERDTGYRCNLEEEKALAA